MTMRRESFREWRAGPRTKRSDNIIFCVDRMARCRKNVRIASACAQHEHAGTLWAWVVYKLERSENARWQSGTVLMQERNKMTRTRRAAGADNQERQFSKSIDGTSEVLNVRFVRPAIRPRE
jgi:hypothetical protein